MSSSSFFSSASQFSPKQLNLLGMGQEGTNVNVQSSGLESSSASMDLGVSNGSHFSSSSTNNRPVTDGNSDRRIANVSTVQDSLRVEERSRKQLEMKKPSPYSNFLLSAVTGPGCHNRSPDGRSRTASSSTPYLVPGYHSPGHRDIYGRSHASPHLHNHASRGFHSPYREGENFTNITGLFLSTLVLIAGQVPSFVSLYCSRSHGIYFAAK